MKKYKNERCIVVDESGNFGKDGRYFVIASIDTNMYKSIYNTMKKSKINIDMKHIDSNAKDGYCIQAIDFIANAIYAYYEKNKNVLYDIIKNKVDKVVLFPR